MARLTLLVLFTTVTLGTALQAQSQCSISDSLCLTGANVNDLDPGISSTQPPTETGRLIPGISSYPFSPFPVPTQSPEAGIFVPADPTNPPPVHSDPAVLPDFEAAWAAAYKKATAKVRFHSMFYESSYHIVWGCGLTVGS